MERQVVLTSVGDCAFNVEFGEGIDRAVNRRVMSLHAALRRARREGRLPGLIETVPTFRSLLVQYDPTRTTRREMEALVLAEIDTAGEAAEEGASWRLPVCYDPDFGPDIDELCRARDIGRDRLIELHAGGSYYIHMLGFMPGFAYMGGLPAALEMPRRAEPRLRVPAGSVAVAGRLTTVYPWESPGGWHIIGRCPVPLFDLKREPPVLLSAGDRVTFAAIGRADFDDLGRLVEAGQFDVHSLKVTA